MVSARTGRPRRETKAVRLTLVLDEETVLRLQRMRAAFTQKWGAPPTYAVLVARSLALSEDSVTDAPPELERLHVAQLQYRRLREVAVNARGRERLFQVWGELVGLLQRTNMLRHSVAKHRKHWAGWTAAQAEAGELLAKTGKLQDQIAAAMKNT